MLTKRRLLALLAVFAAAGCNGLCPFWRAETKQSDPRRTVWVDVFEKAKDSLVTVHLSSSGGSGFVIHQAGYVITNCHVLYRKGDKGRKAVSFLNGKLYPVRPIAWIVRLDIALAKIESDETFVPVKLGRSRTLRVGDPVAVVGNPAGLAYSLTTGKVCLVGVLEADYTRFGAGNVQIDAGINSGNSGGPVFNIDGEVVAVIAAGLGYHNYTGFGPEIDDALAALSERLEELSARDFVLGMTVDAENAGLVTRVMPDTPAHAAGVRAGDIIIQVDDAPITRRLDFRIALVGRRGGDKLRLTLRRNGRTIERTVTLGKVVPRPAEKRDVKGLAKGLSVTYYRASGPYRPDTSKGRPASVGPTDTILMEPNESPDWGAFKYDGYIRVPTDGVYTFYTTSTGASSLRIGDRLVVDNEGGSRAVERRGFIALKAGLHSISALFFDRSTGERLMAQYEGPKIKKQILPPLELFHVRSPRRVYGGR